MRTGVRQAGGGFTLIELLVVIAVVALLVGIAVPGLSRARQAAWQAREGAAIRQFGVAHASYSNDNRSGVMPGYARSEWVSAAPEPGRELVVSYGDSSGARLYGSVARRYTWRLAAYLGYAVDGIVVDRRLRGEFLSLPDSPGTRDGFQWAIGSSPSFGMNTTYVGGDARRGGFYGPALARWGRYYVTRHDEVMFPDRLLVFATSRGYYPVGESERVIPGRHRIEGPWRASRVTDEVPSFSAWPAATEGKFDPGKSPTTYGHVDFRHFGKALLVMFDGHADTVGFREISDMRRWSNQATTADWRP